MRSLRDIAQLFPNARDSGLTDAEVADSRAKFGANRLTPLPREPLWKKFLEKFDEPIIKILLAASLLKIVVDLFERVPARGRARARRRSLAVFVAALVAQDRRLGAVDPVRPRGRAGRSSASPSATPPSRGWR